MEVEVLGIAKIDGCDLLIIDKKCDEAAGGHQIEHVGLDFGGQEEVGAFADDGGSADGGGGGRVGDLDVVDGVGGKEVVIAVVDDVDRVLAEREGARLRIESSGA